MSEMARKTVLTARALVKEYPVPDAPPLRVLDGIHLEVRPGEILAIVGESGAGKSTLLHLLGALDRPTSGAIRLGEMDISEMDEQAMARFRNRYIGFVFQFHHLLPEFTALENVALPGLIARRPPPEVLEKARQLLEEVGLRHRLEHKPRELSGGEQQRVAFARALLNDPVLVLADEPSGNLDFKNSEELHRLMWHLVKEKGVTFVVATHNRALAQSADRCLELKGGRAHWM